MNESRLMPQLDIEKAISQLEENPDLAVHIVAQEMGIHKSVLGRHLRKAGREDLVTRYAKKRAATTAAKYEKMLALLDKNPELIVRHAADQVELHWNGTHVKKRLIKLGREDLLLRLNPTTYKVTKNVEALRGLLDADSNLSVKEAAAKLKILHEVALRQLRARGFEKYINRKHKKARRSRDARASRLVKKLKADPNASARMLAADSGIRHEDFLQYLRDNGHEDLIKNRKQHSTAFVVEVQKYVKDNPKKSCRAVSEYFGVSSGTVKRWCPNASFGKKGKYSAKEKQQIVNLAIRQLDENSDLSLSKLAKKPEIPVSFSCLRKWLLAAGRNDLVTRHRKACAEKASKNFDSELLTDFNDKSFTVALAAQKYRVARVTIVNKLLAAGRPDLINRKSNYDYSQFEIGRIYQMGEQYYIATVKCLITVVDGKVVEALAQREAYTPVDELPVREIVCSWNLNSMQEFDDLIAPYMSHYYTLIEAA